MTIIFLAIFLIVFPLSLLYKDKIIESGENLLYKYDKKTAYLVLFALTAISSTIIPLPVWAYVGAAVLLGLNVYMVSIISGLGTTLGSCCTYVLGRYFSHVRWVRRRLYSDERRISNVKGKLARYGSVALFFVALTPFPADPYYFVCGLLEFPLVMYVFIVLAARILRYLIMGASIRGVV
jgi:membrane protein YqaA with SNARE-associated domain